jgi:cell division septum initiation protein DivIVA
MPDQSSASTEHALMQEITAPLATLPDDPVEIAADVDFPVVLRGYDRIAVDAYVNRTSQLVAELHTTRSPEAAVRRALERVGEEVSGILQRAHETAESITAQSRVEAEDRLEAARQEATEIAAGAQARLRELDSETERIWSERHRIVQDTRELARQLLALADSAAERFPAAEEPEPIPGPEDAVEEKAIPGPDDEVTVAFEEDVTAAFEEDVTAAFDEDVTAALPAPEPNEDGRKPKGARNRAS